MRYLWNMLNKEFTIEGAVSAFLVINMIGWISNDGSRNADLQIFGIFYHG